MNETLLGTAPTTTMTNRQRRAHRDLGRAEKRLIHLIVWEHSETEIQRQEKRVQRYTQAWKQACA